MFVAKKKRLCKLLRRLKLRCSLGLTLMRLALVRRVEPAAVRKQALRAANDFLLASARGVESTFGTEEALNVAGIAKAFVDHPYWSRMTRMLQNMERAEMEVLLSAKQHEQHELSRASIAVCRKVIAMPLLDIEQGKAAVSAVERHEARFNNAVYLEAQQR